MSEGSFYALDNGVWFTASSPFSGRGGGDLLPAVIYSIPRGSPLHYVTYAFTRYSTPKVVYVGASDLSHDFGWVVYGSGWHFRPWIGIYTFPGYLGFWFWHRTNLVESVGPCCFATWRHDPAISASLRGPWHQHARHHPHVSKVGQSAICFENRSRHGVNNIYGRWDRRAVIPLRRIPPLPDRSASIRSSGQGNGSSSDRMVAAGKRVTATVATGMQRARATVATSPRVNGGTRSIVTTGHVRRTDRAAVLFVVGPDGRRQDVGDRSGRRDWKDAGADTRNRAELADTTIRSIAIPCARSVSLSQATSGADFFSRPESGERRVSMNERREPAPRNFADLCSGARRRTGVRTRFARPIQAPHHYGRRARRLLPGNRRACRRISRNGRGNQPPMTRRPGFRPRTTAVSFTATPVGEPSRMPDQAGTRAARNGGQDVRRPPSPRQGRRRHARGRTNAASYP